MSTADFTAQLLTGFAEALQPLIDAGSSPDGLAAFVTDLGWSLDPQLQAVPAEFAAVVSSAADLISQLPDLESDDESKIAAAIQAGVKDAQSIAQQLASLSTVASLPAALQDPQLPAKTVSLLIYQYLESYHPRLFAVLRLIGVLDEIVHNEATAPAVPYIERKLDLNRLGEAFSDPASIGLNVYGWGSNLDPEALLTALEGTAAGFGLGVTEDADAGLDLYYDSTAILGQRSLVIPVWTGTISAAGTLASGEIDLVVLPIPAAGQQSGPAGGIAFFPSLTGQLGAAMELGTGVTLSATGQLDATGAVRAEVRPSGARLIAPGGETVSAEITISAKPDTPYVILGAQSGGSLEIGQAHAALSASASPAGSELRVEVGADEAAVVIDLGQGDGFLQTMIGAKAQRLTFTLAASWSTSRGLAFSGSARPAFDLPVHLNVGGVLAVDTLHVGLSPGDTASGVTVEVSATGSLAFGPLTAAIERMGVLLTVGQRPGHDGNLGDLNLDFGFKAPNGAGLAIDAGVATGGGFIQCDASKGQYAGVLELALESLSLTAIGLIQTKMADGTPLPGGFSLLVIISVEFAPGIELGFGFTLNGVGGYLGLNRTMNADALRAGVRSGSLNDIMFPADPVGHAPQIIQELAGFFPAAPGRFLIGPMVQIQWGSPLPILAADLGVIVELPAPVRVAILGVLQVGLPQADEDAVVLLNLDVLGLVDFGLGTLSLDASLYGSRIADFPVSGDMALRLGWKAEREFIASFGGFFPGYAAPADFPQLRRLAISLSSGDNPTFILQAYLAVTSNTVQFGAYAHLSVNTGQASLDGMLSFDALIHLSPFGLQVDFAAALTVTVDGNQLLAITVNGQITGPAPWQISGQASIHLFFISVSVNFSVQLGSAQPPPPPAPVRVIDRLAADVQNTANWGALPPSGETVVTLTPAPPSGTDMRAHPLGSLTFHQHTVPLEITIEKFGSADVDGPAKLALTSVTYGTSTVDPAAVTPAQDTFAPAQFLRLSDSDALSLPAFVTYQAGVTFTPTAPDLDDLATSDAAALGYTIDLIDSHGQPPAAQPAPLDAQAATRLVPSGSAARAPTRTTGPRRYQGTPGTIAVSPRPPRGREAP